MSKVDFFIKRACEKYGNKYDYSRIFYKGMLHPIEIGCPVHGWGWQTPQNHLGCGTGKLTAIGCKECSLDLRRKAPDEYREKIKKFPWFIENNYSIIELPLNTKSSITLNCPIHGNFTMLWGNFAKGKKCTGCSKKGWKNWGEKAKGRLCTLYLLKLKNENEELYKIGITSISPKRRIDYIPYNCEVLYKHESFNSYGIVDSEKKLHKQLRKFQKMPEIQFGGMYECFKPVPEVIEAFKSINL